MPPNILRVRACQISWSESLVAESRVQGTGEYFPPLQFHAEIVEVEIFAIYRFFGEFRRTNSYCHLHGAQGQGQGQRQAFF
ncbi:hypothetical protein TNCV_3170681 [Trichonephila clavipes]|nr:hypothetical protein TNCV_3170681 [Trichonephila clavipes]